MSKGRKLTQAHKDKISAAMMGKQNFLGHRHTKETRASISAAMMGKRNALGCEVSEETKAAISIALTGRTLSEEHKANIGARWTPERRAAKSAKMIGNQNALGHKQSDEHKAKLSTTAKPRMLARIKTPEGKAQLIKAQQAAAQAHPTKLEKALYKMLDAFGWEYDTEVAFDPYIVDAYIPGLHLALEADGAFHFKGNPFLGTTPEEEAKATRARDAHLQERYDLEVWHFTREMLMSNNNKNQLATGGIQPCQT